MKLFIIEARDENGNLLLYSDGVPQPEEVFGMSAIRGMTDWTMSRVVLRELPELFSFLAGDCIPLWPKMFHPTWIAREKTR
jgi:hypothetical protein